jgi:cellobiose PTS system EIIA component
MRFFGMNLAYYILVYNFLEGVGMDVERLTMQLIMYGGTARSKAMEAIASAKEGNISEARSKLVESAAALNEAHTAQAELIETEAEGKAVPLSLLLVHAQDHLMNAITVKDMATEFVDLYERLSKGASL